MSTSATSHAVMVLDVHSFEKVVQHGVVLVDFSEPWCGPCHLEFWK